MQHRNATVSYTHLDVYKRQVQDGINSIEDLKGKTVATEVGTLEHMFLLKILEENNMTIDDVNFVILW